MSTKHTMKLTIENIDYHRNGVSGEGFFAVTFLNEEDGETKKMVGTVFDNDGFCAVYDRALLATGDIAFGSNSWRGDRFESQLREAIEQYRVNNYKWPVSPKAGV